MKITSPLIITAAIAALLSGCQAMKHGGGETPSKEHPEHPSSKIIDLKREYTAAVNSHISQEIAASGAFSVFDRQLKKDWNLDLVRIHDDKIVGLGDGRYFACADFKEPKTGKLLDLDFYAVKAENGWKIEPALIHKVEGIGRFTYDRNNRKVPI